MNFCEGTPELATELIANAGCYQCGNVNDLIVFDVSILGEGVLSICRNCVLEAAALTGKVLMQEHVVDELEQVKRVLEHTQTELDRKNGLLAELSLSADVQLERQRERDEAQAELRRQRIAQGQHPDTGKFLTKAEKEELLASSDA